MSDLTLSDMLALRKELDPDAPDTIAFPDKASLSPCCNAETYKEGAEGTRCTECGLVCLPSLTDSERTQAATDYCSGAWFAGDEEHTAFLAGWDAAIKHVNEKLAEGVGHLDGKYTGHTDDELYIPFEEAE